jgi:hypothetical protein
VYQLITFCVLTDNTMLSTVITCFSFFFLKASNTYTEVTNFGGGCGGSVGVVVAQLAKAQLGEPDCVAAFPGSIPASSAVS